MFETDTNDKGQMSPTTPQAPAPENGPVAQGEPPREPRKPDPESPETPSPEAPAAKAAASKPSEAAADFAEVLKGRDHVCPIPEVGQKLYATILSIGDEYTFVDYGGRSEARIETKHLKDSVGAPTAKEGDKIEAYVISNEEAVVLAPSLTAPTDESLNELREAQQSGLPVSGKVVGVNPGGLDVEIFGNRAFCPVSQIDTTYCPDPSVFVGQTHDFRITEFREGGKRIVVSRRALLQQEKDEIANRVLESLHVGEVRQGTVVRMESYGAFVDLGGLDGMVHVSEVAHDRVNHPSDVLKLGAKVRVQILEIDKDNKGRNRISLSIKAAQQDPWLTVPDEIQDGQMLTGTIVRLLDFGAFVRLLPGIEGLVHVSEIQDERISHPRDVLKEGDEVKVRVVGIDPGRRRISLTMRIEAGTGGKGPRVGATVEGIARAHKPYGVFIDLPSLGPRASGLLPLEEAGVSKQSELAERFPAGEKVSVLVQQIDERGRIRLAIPSSASGKAMANLGSRGVSKAMADALRKAMEQSGGQKQG